MISFAKWLLLAVGILTMMIAYSSANVQSNAWNAISAQERELLSKRLEQFDALSIDEQESVRRLHELAQADNEEGQKTKSLLDRFGRWFDTLPVSDQEKIQQPSKPDERIVVVKQILQKQSQYLAQAVEPFRDTPRGPFRRPFRYDEKGAAEFLKLLLALRGKISPEELKALETLPRAQSIPLGIALAIKNDLPLPAAANELAPGIFEVIFRLVDDPPSRFAADSFVMLDNEARKKFALVAIDVLMLPDLSDKQRQWLQSQPKIIRTGVQKLAKLTLYQRVIVGSLYFKAHPDEAPESTRDTLQILDPAGAMERFAKLSVGEARPPRPDRPPGEPPRGKP